MPCRRARHLTPAVADTLVTRRRNLMMVIGIDEYTRWPKLGNAVSDARGIRQIFVEKYHFVEPLLPLFNAAATEEALTTLVQDQLRLLLQPDDSLLFFFAGHGHTESVKVGNIDANGRIDLPTLWSDEDVAYLGLQPGKTEKSYPFQLFDKPGRKEARFFATTTRVRYFIAPPGVATRAVMLPVAAAGMTMKAVRYRITS